MRAIFESLSQASRDSKLALLARVFPSGEVMRILDLGGQIESSEPLSRAFPNARITVANIALDHLLELRRQGSSTIPVVANGSKLPFSDGAFDLLYSNAVIEHLRTEAAQQSMAAEIQRVAHRWFVTTPNRWFPFELHSRLPFISWLPPRALSACAYLLSFNHVKGRFTFGNDQSELRLLSASSLQRLFPSSVVVRHRITFWPETLVSYGGMGVRGSGDRVGNLVRG
jgi:hypothetical protein